MGDTDNPNHRFIIHACLLIRHNTQYCGSTYPVYMGCSVLLYAMSDQNSNTHKRKIKRTIKAFVAALIITATAISCTTRIDAGCGGVLVAFGEDNAEVIRTCSFVEKYVKF